MSVKYKRSMSNFFLKKNFQGKFMLAVLLAGLGGGVSTLMLLALFSVDTLTISYDNNCIQMGQTPLMIFKNVLAANWIALVLGGAILVIMAMIGTHRIAGPLFRFEKTLDKMNKGNLTGSIVLRKKDEGKLFAEQINTFNSSLSDNLHQIKKNSRFIKDLTIQFETTNSAKNPEAFKAICLAIQKKNDFILETLSIYTLKDD